ncbi:sensor histidine kinase [Bacillus atrophaeus]|uniref:sensor histidine kinase n=1 Tax=Bacillus atrophaeus TaxID=1452 RepID=UPI002283015B|nr:sensor histidine kinase [Bacillus atrophaeus]MCY8913438.1 sensor histidine kinase [Bacillus atrophaeus]MCY9113604.1 sensor histidine kinase [Bacillus atrophaeus]MEC0925837.1 sensor histidine kinase [Bacillus atrophaeus]MEC0934010.1 sensor histidine kinase [Bacillus atrophaeus]
MIMHMVARHARKLVPSLILIINFIQFLYLPSGAPLFFTILVFALYLGLVWISPYLSTPAAFLRLFAATWLVTISFWIVSGQEQGFPLFLMVFLTGYSALKLPMHLSGPFAAWVIATTSLAVCFIHHSSRDILISNASIFLGIYALFTTFRIRREAREEKERNHAELYEVHQHLAKAHKELQQAHRELEEASIRSLQFAVMEERTRIAHDIHDSIGHQLTSVIVQLQSLPYMMKSGGADPELLVKNVLNVARGCLQEVRSVVHQMSEDESALGITALQSLIRQVEERSDLQLSLNTAGLRPDEKWPAVACEVTYRILQEALTNIIRHANASQVDITLTEKENLLTMQIKDDGQFNGNLTLGFGLTGMKERAEKAGGSLSFKEIQPHGLQITAILPLER